MPKSVRLSKLLQAHDRGRSKVGLRQNFGDAYLCERFFVFRAIREASLNIGVTYTTDDPFHYHAHNLAALQALLKSKKIPYLDNVSPLKSIEKRRPRLFDFDEIAPSVSNFILHESAHVVADSILRFNDLQQLGLRSEQARALKMVMAEAFANTVEIVGNVSISSEVDRIFYRQNSYLVLRKKRREQLRILVEQFGFTLIHYLIFISYLYSNSLYARLPRTDFKRIVKGFVTDRTVCARILRSKLIAEFVGEAFDLAIEFRVKTTSFYFAFVGLKSNLFDLLDFDLPAIICETPAVGDFFNRTNELLVKEQTTKVARRGNSKSVLG